MFPVPGSKFLSLRVQVNLLQSTLVCAHTGLARNFNTKATILCLVPCFIMVVGIYLTGHRILLTFLA